MIKIRSKGDYKHTLLFLTKSKEKGFIGFLNDLGKRGIDALRELTPKDTGKTSESWIYEVNKTNSGYKLSWHNINFDSQGVPIAILIQYGHTTSRGYIVEGRDYINPAMKPIFDSILEELNSYIFS